MDKNVKEHKVAEDPQLNTTVTEQ